MSKDVYVDFIKNEISTGDVLFNSVHKKFFTKFNLTKPTFAKYWKIANEEYAKERALINAEKIQIQATKELKHKIKTREQLLKKLNDIIDQKALKGTSYRPNFTEVIRAIALYVRVMGYEAPPIQPTGPIGSNDIYQKLFDKLNSLNKHDY
jgi:hypothetical protein